MIKEQPVRIVINIDFEIIVFYFSLFFGEKNKKTN